MKTLLLFTFLFLTAMSSCVVAGKHDNGKHKGWYKNPHNPHNPAPVVVVENGKTPSAPKGKENKQAKKVKK